jgi:hypothetical protein
MPLALLMQAISLLICIYFHYGMALDMPLFLWSMIARKWPKIAAWEQGIISIHAIALLLSISPILRHPHNPYHSDIH